MIPLLRLVNVKKRYVTGSAGEILPVRDVSVDIKRGERIGLLGKSGSGKTTFLNLVGGVDTPSSGMIYFNGRDLGELSSPELAEYRRSEVGFVFQSFNLFPTLTVGENIMLPLDLLGIHDENRARAMLEAVGLDGQWDKFPEQLSGGEQQRVAIARALVKSPSLILADEPTGNLDLETSNQVLRIIDEVCRDRDATLIMATHSLESLWLADRIFRLQGGSLIEQPRSGSREIVP
ncbi:MAG: ABC transporter ATP-binding protein [Desulfomonile sp.]|nr:ABC transporter ATP-binding protein [Desulfomonile sp.]